MNAFHDDSLKEFSDDLFDHKQTWWGYTKNFFKKIGGDKTFEKHNLIIDLLLYKDLSAGNMKLFMPLSKSALVKRPMQKLQRLKVLSHGYKKLVVLILPMPCCRL